MRAKELLFAFAIGMAALPLFGERPIFRSRPTQTPTSAAGSHDRYGLEKPDKKNVLKTASGDESLIFGNLVFRKNYPAEFLGLYSMAKTAGATPEVVAYSDMRANGGGVWLYDDNRYVAATFSTSASGAITNPRLVTYDADTWEQVYSLDVDATAMSWDLCYNPADGNVYGSFPTDASISGVFFGKLNVNTGKSERIADATLPYIALASDGSGVMYGIEQGTGNLYRVSTDGSRELIGSTGVIPVYFQSATFDYSDGKMYWMACLERTSALYEVDTETAKLTMVNDMASTLDEWAGIFSRSVYVNHGTPGEVSELAASFEGISTTGTLSFRMPEEDNDGNALGGKLRYEVYVNGDKTAEGTSNAGESVSCGLNAPEGMVKFSVAAVNDKGEGLRTSVTQYIGVDTPAVPTLIVCEGDNSTRTVRWQPVTGGANGGAIDLSDVTYSVTRQPDNVTVAENIAATTVGDNTVIAALDRYTYRVTAKTREKVSEAGESNGIVLGEPLNAPVVSDFENADHVKLYTTEDANDDDNCWGIYNDHGQQVFRYRYHPLGHCGDDWLFSPPVYLEKGKVYPLDILADRLQNDERLEVKFGRSPKSAEMTGVVFEPYICESIQDLDGNLSVYHRTGYVVPEESGTYYIGYHAMSDPDCFYLLLRSWSIEEPVAATVPTKVTEAGIAPAAMGELSCDISFKAPATDFNGNTLTAIDRIVVTDKKDGRQVGVIENPVPGSQYTLSDAVAEKGLVYYDITPVGGGENGETITVSEWVGLDIPMSPTDVVWRMTPEGAEVSWQPAGSTGAHGGYVNPDDVTYTVMAYYPDQDIIYRNIKETSCVDANVLDLTDKQESVYFRVYARNSSGRSEHAFSQNIGTGKPIALPFAESFPGKNADNYVWCIKCRVDTSTEARWNVVDRSYDSTLLPYDNDGGMMLLHVLNGGETLICSPLVSLPAGSLPVLTFYASRSNADTELEALITTDHGATWESLATAGLTSEGEWTLIEADLTKYAGKEINIGFRASAPRGAFDTAVDNIRIFDATGVNDIAVEGDSLRVTASGENVTVAGASGDVRIYNVAGMLVKCLGGNGRRMTTLPSGIYVCRDNSARSVKFIVK